MKTRVSLKYFVNDCFWKKYFASNFPQIPSNQNSLTVLDKTRRPVTHFYPKIKAIKWQIYAKICFTWLLLF